MGLLDAPVLTPKAAAAKFPAKKFAGSPIIKSMIDAPVMTAPPTITVGAAATLPRNLTAYWSGFRVSGCPTWDGSSGASWRYPLEAPRLSGAKAKWTGAWRTEFTYSGTAFEFRMNAEAGSRFQLWVNGRPHVASPVLHTSVAGVSAGNIYYFKFTFPQRLVEAHIILQLEGTPGVGGGSGYSAFHVEQTATPLPPQITSPRFMVAGGDSFTFGAAAELNSQGYVNQLGRMMGWADVWWSAAVGSTGIAREGSDGVFGNYRSRMAGAVLPHNPDILWYQASINDQDNIPMVAAQLESDLAYLKANLPNALIFGTSPLQVLNPNSAHIQIEGIVAPIFAAAGVPYLNLLFPSGSPSQIFRGTGSVVAPTGDGNADFYNTNNHPNAEGHRMFARIFSRWLSEQLGVPL